MPSTRTNGGPTVECDPDHLAYIDDSDTESDCNNVTNTDSDVVDRRHREINNASVEGGDMHSDTNTVSNGESDESESDSDDGHEENTESTPERRDVNINSLPTMQPPSNEDQEKEILDSSPDIVKEEDDMRSAISDDGSDGSDLKVNRIRRETLRRVRSPRDDDGDKIITPSGKLLKFDRSEDTDCIDESIGSEQTDRAEIQSCSSETSEENELVESKIKQLYICRRSRFVTIDSRTSRHGGVKLIRHYITKGNNDTDIIGDIGLLPVDELLYVNDQSLKNLKQKEVKRIFKKIRIKKETNEVNIILDIRRWVKSSQLGPMQEIKWTSVKEIRFQMTLIPDQTDNVPCGLPKIKASRNKPLRRRQSFKVESVVPSTRKEEKLNPGYIQVDRIGSVKTNTIKCVFTNSFVSNVASVDNLVSLSVITNETTCRFDVESFSGLDLSPKSAFGSYLFCVRLRVQRREGFAFLSSNIQGGEEKLKFVKGDDDFQSIKESNALDERCFIVRSIGSSDLYQSPIYRDRFIAYDKSLGYLFMKQIPHAQQEAFVSGQEHREDRNLNYFAAKEVLRTCWFSRSNPNTPIHKRLGRYFQSFLCGNSRVQA